MEVDHTINLKTIDKPCKVQQSSEFFQSLRARKNAMLTEYKHAGE